MGGSLDRPSSHSHVTRPHTHTRRRRGWCVGVSQVLEVILERGHEALHDGVAVAHVRRRHDVLSRRALVPPQPAHLVRVRVRARVRIGVRVRLSCRPSQRTAASSAKVQPPMKKTSVGSGLVGSAVIGGDGSASGAPVYTQCSCGVYAVGREWGFRNLKSGRRTHSSRVLRVHL